MDCTKTSRSDAGEPRQQHAALGRITVELGSSGNTFERSTHGRTVPAI
jgi:hypothetical protein